MITSVICALTLYASFAVAYFPVAIYHCGLGWGGYEPDPLQRFVAIVDSILVMIVIAVVAHTLSTIFRKKAATIVILIIEVGLIIAGVLIYFLGKKVRKNLRNKRIEAAQANN